jgi:hypothetical protein
MRCLASYSFCISFIIYATVAHGQSLRQQAEDKFGKDSQVWFAEPVSTGPSRWDPPTIASDQGIILEWNAQKLILVRPEASKETIIPGDYVTRIEPAWTDPDAASVHTLFLERQFQKVVSSGSEVLKKTTMPRWQQRLILAEVIQALTALRRTSAACKVFVSLSKENAPQLLLSVLPVPWGQDKLDEDTNAIQSLAEEWVLDPNEAVQFMGAAWLLSGPKRSLATETLEGLAKKNALPIVSSYARIQLWRTVPPSDILSGHYPSWIEERDKLLLPTQAGPTCLLANRLAQAGQPSLALPQWLRIASLHADRYDLLQDSVAKSVAALRSLGRIDEAQKVERLGQSVK